MFPDFSSSTWNYQLEAVGSVKQLEVSSGWKYQAVGSINLPSPWPCTALPAAFPLTFRNELLNCCSNLVKRHHFLRDSSTRSGRREPPELRKTLSPEYSFRSGMSIWIDTAAAKPGWVSDAFLFARHAHGSVSSLGRLPGSVTARKYLFTSVTC